MNVQLLIVDDHAVVTEGLSALLNGSPDIVLKGTAANGQEALDLLSAVKVDVVLMDVDMPVMGGLEATRRIRKSHPDVRIIILTMHDEQAMVRALLEAGAHGYLLKNSDYATILDAVRTVMEGKEFIGKDVESILLQERTPTLMGPLSGLTAREAEILALIAEGLSNKEIGEKLFISHRTVDTHRTNLMQKLNVHNIAGLVRIAIENGLVR